MMFVETQQQKELNSRERQGQDATKITSAFADSCIQFLRSAMPMPPLTWIVKHIPNRTTIDDFTEEVDETRFVRQYNFFSPTDENVVSVFGSYEPVCIVSRSSSSSLVTVAILIPHWVVNSDRLSPEEGRLREDYCYEAPRILSTHHRPGVQ